LIKRTFCTEETIEFAESIGKLLRAGDVIAYKGGLGAGKTTLIKKLIKEAYKGEQIVLIENEFGEIGVDGGFLSEA